MQILVEVEPKKIHIGNDNRTELFLRGPYHRTLFLEPIQKELQEFSRIVDPIRVVAKNPY